MSATTRDAGAIGPEAIRDAWDAIAPVYDLLTAAHDHDDWARQLETLAVRAGQTGRRLLDVGCGAGDSTAAMLARGYDATGVDVSPGMLTLARRRLGPDVPLYRHDMRTLPILGSFDAVWAVGDAVNFLLDDTELADAFSGFARNLAPGGRVVFDVDTLRSFRTLYTSLLVVPGEDRIVVFDGQADGELQTGDIAEAFVDALERGSPPWWQRTRGVHRQCHHDRAAIARALATAGLELVDVWGTDGAGGSSQPLDEERHNKAVYIAQAVAHE